MFRYLANKYHGRVKTKDETLDLEEVASLLDQISDDTPINVKRYSNGRTERIPSSNPNCIMKNVRRSILGGFDIEFNRALPGDRQNHIRHQVYSGPNEKHYIKIIQTETHLDYSRPYMSQKEEIDFILDN